MFLQSIYHPTHALCDTPFMAYNNTLLGGTEHIMLCYYIPLLWWVPENGTSVSKLVAIYIYIYIYMLQIVYHSTYCGWCVDCSLTLNPGTLATVSFYLPLVNICPQLYMMSPLLCNLVLSTVHSSAALCVFVTCGNVWCDVFTGCAV